MKNLSETTQKQIKDILGESVTIAELATMDAAELMFKGLSKQAADEIVKVTRKRNYNTIS